MLAKKDGQDIEKEKVTLRWSFNVTAYRKGGAMAKPMEKKLWRSKEETKDDRETVGQEVERRSLVIGWK